MSTSGTRQTTGQSPQAEHHLVALGRTAARFEIGQLIERVQPLDAWTTSTDLRNLTTTHLRSTTISLG